MIKKFSILVIALILAFTAQANNLQSFVGKVHDGYNFWLSSPKVSGDQKKPLIVFLHGASLRGKNLQSVLRYGTLDAMKRGLGLDAYVLAPQTPGAWTPSKVMNTIDYVIENNPAIDTNRIYVIGMSLGGYGTIDLAATYPDRIAAAMAICGGGSVKNLDNLNKLPLWIVHGTGDRAVSVKESDKVVASMRKTDSNTSRLIYTRVPGMNHSQPARLLYMPRVYEWLFTHSLADEGRKISKGFAINNQTMSSAYRDMRGAHVSVETAAAKAANNP